jgi:EAL and modified HD-GYP domain-containing signal transduction protein
MAVSLDPRNTIHIARQPILDANRRLFGYELLYRAGALDQSCTTSPDLAAARTLVDAIQGIGLDALTGKSKAFINVTRQLLLDDVAALLPPQSVVIELREDIEVDEEVIEACRALQARGYVLALDDFVAGSGAEALAPYVKFVKLDVLEPTAATWQPVARRFVANSVRVVAERVETIDVVAQARDAGCSLFQGYYFCRPATRSVKAIPGRRLAYLHLFAAISRPDLTIAMLEDLVKRDVSLTVRVLRSINSAAYGLRQEITSLRHALVLLGIQQVRNWAAVWAMAGVNSGGTPEAVSVALLRARSCEVIGHAWSGAEAGGQLFLLGMCSMLDAILDQPMDQAIAGLELLTGVRDALLGGSNALRSILDAVVAYEQGDWDRAGHIVRTLGLPERLLPSAYSDALRWARELSLDAAAA